MATLKVGRSAESDIVVQHQSVSRTHAEIEILGGGRYRINDLGSTSGTEALVAGKWVAAQNLEVEGQTPVALGEHETTVDALLRAARDNVATQPPPRRTPPPAPPVRSEAEETVAAIPGKVQPAAPAVRKQPLAGDRTRFWLMVGGGAALFIVLVALVLALVLDDGTTSSLSGSASPGSTRATAGPERERLIAACRKTSGPGLDCACMADLIIADFSGRERELFIRLLEEGIGPNPERAQRMLSQLPPMDAARFMEKFIRLGPKLEKCGR
jgi:hypothetical protein